jgi:predicted nucleic acid-binding protein
VTRLVIDASIAVKWVVTEMGTDLAVALLSAPLCAPDLLVPECANILRKKVRRGELTAQQAAISAGLIQRADVELYPMRMLMEPATKLAIDLDHPAYDCFYLALAMTNDWRFATADTRFLDRARQSSPELGRHVLSLEEAAATRAKGRHP